jgi:Protein of unknown function (DUF4232)
MDSVMPRVFAIVATFLGITFGGSVSAQPAPHVMRPICLTDVAVRAADPSVIGDVHQTIVTVSRAAGFPCAVANFPQVVLINGSARPVPLPASRLSLAQSATIGAGSTATFVLRYVTTPLPAAPETTAPAAEPGCALAFAINGTLAKGPPLAAAPCANLTEIAVSSFAPGSSPPDDALASPPPQPPKVPCRPQDLELRDVGPDTTPGSARETYAIQNVGLGPCRLTGGVGAVLRDAKGAPIPLRVAPRTAMAMLLILLRGHDASFTVAYTVGGPNGEQRCVAARSIAVTIPGNSTPLIAATRVAPCPPATGPGMRISNLRLGVPLPELPRP